MSAIIIRLGDHRVVEQEKPKNRGVPPADADVACKMRDLQGIWEHVWKARSALGEAEELLRALTAGTKPKD